MAGLKLDSGKKKGSKDCQFKIKSLRDLKIYERQTNFYNIFICIDRNHPASQFDQPVFFAESNNNRTVDRYRRDGHGAKETDDPPEFSDHRKFSLYAGKGQTRDNAVFRRDGY